MMFVVIAVVLSCKGRNYPPRKYGYRNKIYELRNKMSVFYDMTTCFPQFLRNKNKFQKYTGIKKPAASIAPAQRSIPRPASKTRH